MQILAFEKLHFHTFETRYLPIGFGYFGLLRNVISPLFTSDVKSGETSGFIFAEMEHGENANSYAKEIRQSDPSDY